MPSPGLKTILAAAALTLAVAAPAAHADSIAYVRSGDVYLTTPDGTRQLRVTTTGDYSTVSQADDGTLIGTAGNRLRRIDPKRGVLADFATPVTDDRTSGRMFYGPYDATISPDGTKVAYGFYAYLSYYDASCNCVKYKWKQGTAYTRPDRLTAWDDPYKWETGWTDPSWLDAGTWTLSSVGPGYPSDDVYVHNSATGDGGTWFSDRSAYSSLKDGELARDFKNMAFVGDTSTTTGQFLQLYRSTGAPTGGQVFRCDRFQSPTGAFASPSFSPDGRRLAFADGEGIYTVDVGDGSACATLTPPSHPLVAGASSPDWGPADVPAPPVQQPDPTPSPDPTTTPTPAPPAGGGGGTTPPAPVKPGGATPTPVPGQGGGGITTDQRGANTPLPSALLQAKAGKASRKGLTLTVIAPAAGKVTATGTLRGKAVLKGTATAAKGGRVTLRLKPTAAGRRALKRGAKVSVVVTQGGARTTVRVRLAR